MKCSKCSGDIDESLFPAGLAYCPYCGDPLPSGGPEQAITRMAFCPYCGQELTAPTRFCPHCGQNLAEHLPPPTQKGAGGRHEAVELIGRTADALKRTFGPERKRRKLYQQWAEHSGLPPEELAALEQAAPEAPQDIPLDEARGYRAKRTLPVLYIILAAAVLIVIIGIVLLITKT